SWREAKGERSCRPQGCRNRAPQGAVQNGREETPMTGKPLDPDKAAKKLTEELERCRPGMLGLGGGKERHLHPMIRVPAKKGGAIWFFAPRDAGVVHEVSGGPEAATFCVTAPKRNFFACVGGKLTVEKNRDRADAHWNAKLESWLPGGKGNADIVSLRLDIED